MARRARPVLLSPTGPMSFPDPEQSDGEGLLAVGGDLTPERLILAYESGIFPWYAEGLPPMWWSPDPRAVIDEHTLHVSKSLARELRRGRFRVSSNEAFERVMRECGRERDGGTWILPEMVRAYVRLYELGHARSFEVWLENQLVGGLYGVQRGALFAAESMFHRETNASKVALVAAVRSLFAAGITLMDVQFLTPHLASMGVREIPRRLYLAQARNAVRRSVSLDELTITLL
ncbi:MAG TPA: leucyl/phenylalanyl-tRNA--protein transferase [Polyangiaceae bacterium]|nr:leucyl/phenylalanyl-tRNA--protein transferase [Polyangiaceae bacterium]